MLDIRILLFSNRFGARSPNILMGIRPNKRARACAVPMLEPLAHNHMEIMIPPPPIGKAHKNIMEIMIHSCESAP